MRLCCTLRQLRCCSRPKGELLAPTFNYNSQAITGHASCSCWHLYCGSDGLLCGRTQGARLALAQLQQHGNDHPVPCSSAAAHSGRSPCTCLHPPPHPLPCPPLDSAHVRQPTQCSTAAIVRGPPPIAGVLSGNRPQSMSGRPASAFSHGPAVLHCLWTSVSGSWMQKVLLTRR